MSILKEKPSIILSIKHTLNKFVLIFVLIVKWDFPKVWPDAFSELLSVMTHTQDIELQKEYLKFIIHVLLTLNEELIERYDGKEKYHTAEKSNDVKDGIRAGPIADICVLLN